jgi:hypothetical protein
MKPNIHLKPAWYDCLRRYVPEDSHAATALKNAVKLDGSLLPTEFLFQCDENDAQILLETARQHCPDAVWEIQLALEICAPLEL